VMLLFTQWSDSVWVLALVGSGVPAYLLWMMWKRAR